MAHTHGSNTVNTRYAGALQRRDLNRVCHSMRWPLLEVRLRGPITGNLSLQAPRAFVTERGRRRSSRGSDSIATGPLLTRRGASWARWAAPPPRSRCEMQARYGRDAGEMWARCGRDMGEMWARYGRDVGEMWAAASPHACARAPVSVACMHMCSTPRAPRAE